MFLTQLDYVMYWLLKPVTMATESSEYTHQIPAFHNLWENWSIDFFLICTNIDHIKMSSQM